MPRPQVTRSRWRDLWLMFSALVWGWAVAQLCTRHHLVVTYAVSAHLPPVTGFLALPKTSLAAIALVTAALAIGAVRTSRKNAAAAKALTLYLSAAAPLLLLDLARIGWSVPPLTWLEPLWLTVCTGGAVSQMARSLLQPPADGARIRRAWLLAVCAAAVLAAFWWYNASEAAFNDFMLGYLDFGDLARRIINTWEGRGLLNDFSGKPVFWDHFNPGQLLLAPLAGSWQDARLFFVLQAFSLAVGAPLIYGIARRFGADACGAACWAGAWLVYPALGQLNLSYTYGWHATSNALPLILATALLLLDRRWSAAVIAALFACSFKETVVFVFACVASAMCAQRWLASQGHWIHLKGKTVVASKLSQVLASKTWLVIAAAMWLAFFLIVRFAGFAEFQSSRLNHLGSNTLEVLLSPVTRASVFWPQVAGYQSLMFLLALAVPLGPLVLLRGWPTLLGIVPALAVLLMMDDPMSASVGFHYTATLTPILFLAALHGAQSRHHNPSTPADDNQRRLSSSGAYALAAGVTASIFFGAMPWSVPNLDDVYTSSYLSPDGIAFLQERASGTEGNRVLHEVVGQIGDERASILATGRVAAHLLHVERLELIAHARQRWDAWDAETGPDRSPIELFDWIIIDDYEHHHQPVESKDFVVAAAAASGYRIVRHDHGLILIARPAPAAD